MLEADHRFHPFDLQGWTAFNTDADAAAEIEADSALPPPAPAEAAEPGAVCHSVPGSPFDRLPEAIRAAIEAALPQAVTYRRREFEHDAMLRELCARNGLRLPPPPAAVGAAVTPVLRVCLLCNEATAGTMLPELCAGLISSERVELRTPGDGGENADTSAELDDDADKVLVLLTAGVLAAPRTLAALERVLAADAASGADRLVLVFHEAAGWKFGEGCCRCCTTHPLARAASLPCADLATS